MGEYEAAARAGQHALAIGAAGSDLGLQVAANCFLGQLFWSSGDYRRAVECCRWNADSIPDHLVRERFGLSGLPAMLSRLVLVMRAVELGEFTVAVDCAEEGLWIGESIGQPYSLVMACMALAEPASPCIASLRKWPPARPTIERR